MSTDTILTDGTAANGQVEIFGSIYIQAKIGIPVHPEGVRFGCLLKGQDRFAMASEGQRLQGSLRPDKFIVCADPNAFSSSFEICPPVRRQTRIGGYGLDYQAL